MKARTISYSLIFRKQNKWKLATPEFEQTRASTRLVINAQFIKDKCKLNLYHITTTTRNF